MDPSKKTHGARKAFLFLMILCIGTIFAYRTDLIFSNLGLKEGLSQGTVLCILKDHKGFMWFGTYDGLNRYDGLSFLAFHYNVDNPESLSHNSISCLFEDAQGRLWVGTSGGGLNRMESGVPRFTRYQHSEEDADSVISDSIRSLCQDPMGNFWVATDRGLDCMVKGSGRFTHYQPNPADAGSLADSNVNVVLADGADRIWIVLRNTGLDCYDPRSGRFTHYRHDPKNDQSLASDRGSTACLTADGAIWIGHDQGRVSRFSTVTGLTKRYALGAEAGLISGICADTKGNIWVSSENGLYFLNTSTGQWLNIRSNPRFPASLTTNLTTSVFVDDTDIAWVGTFAFGVNKANIKAKRFINYVHDPSNPNTLGFTFVRGIYQDRKGMLYVGGLKGFDGFDPVSGSWRHFFMRESDNAVNENYIIYCICPNSEDERDLLLLGTEGGIGGLIGQGLFLFDPLRQAIRRYPVAGMHGRQVYALFKENRDTLWIGTEEGLHRYDLKSKKIDYFDLKKIAGMDPASTPTQDVYWVMRDRQGILWVSARYIGLFSLDPWTNQWRYFSHDPKNPRSLSSNLVTAILESRAGELWVGTYGAGMNRMDRNQGTFEHFTTTQGLPNDIIYGILEDDKGQLWISCNFGLCRFDPGKRSFRSFTFRDGLIGNEFNSGSFYKNPRTGQLFFGGTNGLTAFYPDEIQDDPHPPSVVIEDLKIFNRSIVPGPGSVLPKPIGETDSIALTYKHSMLTFEFNGLHYVAPSKNRFAYFLEGFDQQWNQTDAYRRYATYTNLNPGHYRLKVKAANSDGVWNETGKTLDIYIAPPFWKTTWFRFLLIAFTLALLFSIYHFRVRGLQKRKAELESLVDLRTQELKEMSLSDPMTNLRNRRYVSDVLMDEVSVFIEQWKHVVTNGQRRKAAFPQSSMGLFIIDVDFFKAINDKYGHKAGDLFLNEFASILRKCVRRDDVVVRWGGEEFLVILKNCDVAFLTVVAEKIRKMVEINEFLISETEEIRVRSSCSIGIVRYPFVETLPDLVSFDHAVILADMAMYLGKENGRNRTIYLEHSGLIPEKAEIQELFYPLETLKGSGFIKVHECNSSATTST